ncbi:MAG: hypothetical protein JW818_17590, partial [Pirellulales bacterium]|nr:hypothetical protein [Pirellulales bacterium]
QSPIPNPQSPIPNPQSPIPNPQSPLSPMLRRLAQRWLRNVTSQTVRRRAEEAVREQVDRARQTQADMAGDPKCQVGLVFALGIEAGGLVDRLETIVSTRGEGFVARRGRFEGRRIVLVESGTGPQRAAKATEALIAGHQPEWIVSAGFAGGLNARLKRHDLVLADSVAHTDGRRLAIDLKADPAAFGPGVHVGRIVSAEKIVRLPADKERLGQEHDALAVDLESFAVAEVCRREQVRFLDIRVITDAVNEPLPADVQRLTDQPSPAARLGAAVGAIWRRPSSVKDMLSLRQNAMVASDHLAALICDVIRTLCPPPK